MLSTHAAFCHNQRSEVLTSIVPDSPVVLHRLRERGGAPVTHQKCLTDRLKSGGMNYENPAIFAKSYVVPDATGRRSAQGCADHLHSRDCVGLDNALHGSASAERRRPVARSGEARTRSIVEG